MSSSIVYAQGNKVVTVAAAESIAVYSKSPCQVFRRLGYPQLPDQDSLLGTVSNGQTVFGPFSAGATIVITPGASVALYEVGTDPAVTEVTSRLATAPVPGVLNATGALTSAMILAGIVTSTTGAAVAGTIPTGPVLEAAADFDVGDKVQWSVINTGGNTFTVTAASGHTIVGVAAVVTVTSGLFETRKVSAGVFVTYRLS